MRTRFKINFDCPNSISLYHINTYFDYKLVIVTMNYLNYCCYVLYSLLIWLRTALRIVTFCLSKYLPQVTIKLKKAFILLNTNYFTKLSTETEVEVTFHTLRKTIK